ncbi:MAG TPA: FAD-dependent oxidoreductase [Ktedonobacteraceae bacterium]|nr:FAD-dependent oxidoreductase [Ktedonobacteraceae bacterium]
MKERQTDIVIIGGGLGGFAGALAALRLGKRVIITEETDWIGGQITSQAVPPDEHPWIESSGCTASYRRFREGVRNYYRQHYPMTPEARAIPNLNPGQGNVSRLCHEPRVGLAVLESMLAPYISSGQADVLLQHRPVSVEHEGDRVRAVVVESILNGEQTVIVAPYILDATELGDLLPLAGVEHVIGAESQAQTNEPHAIDGEAQPLDQQAITWCFAMDYFPEEDHTIEKPEEYDFWRSYQAPFWPDRHLSWRFNTPITLQPTYRPLFLGPSDEVRSNDFWHYRRILYRKHYPEGLYGSDIVLVNWWENDYWLGPLLGVSEEEAQRNLWRAKQLSLSLLYWMQTEAERPEGGYGYPGLRLRPELMGTSDGLAKSIYIRESRRIQAEFTVTENHVGVEARQPGQGAEIFHDTVGIGSYRIDLHPSSNGRDTIDISTWPFQIPLGALIPARVENLLPANKNIGSTHITNGCYRLHPVEWNIGEAAGALAAYCLTKGLVPRQVRNTPALLHDFQRVLSEDLGFELSWSDEIRVTQKYY